VHTKNQATAADVVCQTVCFKSTTGTPANYFYLTF